MTAMDKAPLTDTFVPDKENSRQLRDAFGRFATGVTIVTTNTPDGPVAITANSFSSVSLDPPLVLWSPDKGSRRYDYFVNAEHFVIHVLSSAQQDICWKIAKDAYGLRGMDIPVNIEGVPILTESLARFECRRHAIYEGGDHAIVLGEVLRAAMREEGDALGFFKGKAGVFTAS